ncbi:phosphatase PAP2 family protein [Pelagibacterium halotolerans]|uniref:phosphatase PAP2 family protein n=1 Tax=Pelagibacterium halotolerans TaxID=531813 RepID=UPI00384FA6A9
MRVWRNLRARNSRRRLLVLWPMAGLLTLLLVAILFDRDVSLALQSWPGYERAFFAFITDFGTSGWILYPTLLGMLVGQGGTYLPLTYSWRWAARSLAGTSFYIFASVGISGLVTVVLKRLIGRGRPLYLDDYGVLYFDPLQILDWRLHSFPSGHATTAMAFSVVLFTILNGRYRIAVFGTGLAIGLSRIVVGDHYLSDVIGGTVVGTLTAIVIRDFFATRNWSMRFKDGQIRFRIYTGFLPLLRKIRRGHIPVALK